MCCFQTHCWCKCPLQMSAHSLSDHRYVWSLDVNKRVVACSESQQATTPIRAQLRQTMKIKSISYSNPASFKCEKGLCSCPPPPPLIFLLFLLFCLLLLLLLFLLPLFPQLLVCSLIKTVATDCVTSNYSPLCLCPHIISHPPVTLLTGSQ